MRQPEPPRELDSADVLEFACIDASVTHDPDGPYMVHDGIRLGPVSGLVIARNQFDPADILLFFCDDDWNVLAAAGWATVAEVKANAEKQYRGVSGLWRVLDGV